MKSCSAFDGVAFSLGLPSVAGACESANSSLSLVTSEDSVSSSTVSTCSCGVSSLAASTTVVVTSTDVFDCWVGSSSTESWVTATSLISVVSSAIAGSDSSSTSSSTLTTSTGTSEFWITSSSSLESSVSTTSSVITAVSAVSSEDSSSTTTSLLTSSTGCSSVSAVSTTSLSFSFLRPNNRSNKPISLPLLIHTVQSLRQLQSLRCCVWSPYLRCVWLGLWHLP